MLKKEVNLYFVLRIIIISILLKTISFELECEREIPIKIGTECLSTFCSDLQFKSGECIKSNSIIKTQWLNNIILVGQDNFRYINFITSNGKTIFSTTPNPLFSERIYFGINSIGEAIFKDTNEDDIYIYKKECKDENCDEFESISGSLKVNGDINQNKQYLVSIGKSYTNTEIFDFENYEDEIKIIKYENIVKYPIEISSGNFINIFENDKQYYIIGLIMTRKFQPYFYLLKFYLYYDTNNNILCESIDSNTTKISSENKIAYCYLLDKKKDIIICINLSSDKAFVVSFFDTNLQFKQDRILSIKYDYSSVKIFFKFFPYKDYIYFLTYYKKNNDVWYPIIQIIEIITDESSYSVKMSVDPIELNKYNHNNNIMLTDIILKENLLCLASTQTNKETLIIILINFYNNMDYNVRYYLIDFFNLYKHKFLADMKLHLYNNNFIFGFSFCKNTTCNNDNDQHHCALIFFSYSNINDYNLDIIDYLNKEENKNVILNLFDFVNIDNNIFGYIVYGIKIYSIDDCGISFISNETNETIKENDTLSKNENLKIIFTENEYQIKTCSIKYRAILTEPDYDEYNKYPNYILNNNDKNYFAKSLYEGKVGKYNIVINQQLTTNCEEDNINCNLCLKNDKNHCLICKYDYTFINNMKICNELIDCDIENIAKGKCPDNTLTNEELKDMYWYIKYEIINEDYNFENIIIPTSDVYFQISSYEDQRDFNLDISSIDLKDCQQKLKNKYKIDDEDSLIIFKIDIKNKETLITYVKYEIYSPYTLELLNLTSCDESNIIMNIPVDLDSETINLYDSINQQGYNLFNPNDSFYNDICSTYKSDNGTDIILSDRQKNYYMKNGNKPLCQKNCTIEKYNAANKKVVCQCSAQYEINEPDLNNLQENFNFKELIDKCFINSDNSNVLILKCYNLVFHLKNAIKNIGMIIMTIVLIISITTIIIHFIKERQKINSFIESILKMKFFKNKNSRSSLKNSKSIQLKVQNNKNIKKKRNFKNRNNSINIFNIFNKIENKKEPPKKNVSRNSQHLQSSDSRLKLNLNNNFKGINKKKILNKKEKRIKRKSKINNSSSDFVKKEWVKELKSLDHSKIAIINKLTETELNDLDYKMAINKDKRTYIQYYWSLLKKKQLILFTFFPTLDYNLFSIKLTLFLISFYLSFTLNALFFDDETMHKIYANNGNYIFLNQMIKIIYPTLICTVVNTTLRLLSLSEKKILEIKSKKNLKESFNKSKEVQKFFSITYMIFFIFSFILLIFCWYFISCFCIVYNNTQIILIKDTLISYSFTLINPFGLSLIPGIFRIYALRAKNKDKICLYKISLIIALV